MPHRRHACVLTAALAFLAAACATATPYVRDNTVRVETDTVNAASLGRRVAYNVVLPSRYEANQRYPVLWLLHG
jgi:hypothetical protein